MKTLKVIAQTDWALLKHQKLSLLALDTEEAAGLINWIDQIQDAAVLDQIASEQEVFGLDSRLD